ncbi:hypothetical protein M5D96_007392 [Drosophila gunungcola]|uniref:Uncharacterized protein n=1 Tax=Drosophila gunungcola TaxID=103775 RepID=A0A9Q0BPN2_9MUSC|nr:hypothetical protein M5D96_007392 [Drosophila gunungcola]
MWLTWVVRRQKKVKDQPAGFLEDGEEVGIQDGVVDGIQAGVVAGMEDGTRDGVFHIAHGAIAIVTTGGS